MPKYKFEFEADKATATALMQLAMETSINFSMSVEGEEPKKIARHKVTGKSTWGAIVEKAISNVEKKVTLPEMEAIFRTNGWNESSISPAVSRLVATGLFKRTAGKGVEYTAAGPLTMQRVADVVKEKGIR